MTSLSEDWPDPDRRDEALVRCLVDVYEAGESPNTRQLQVLEGFSHGLGRQGVADLLGIDIEAVKSHLRLAKRILGAKTTAGACCEALRRGLIR